jgi:homopolymeric O-antigen transport system permease protein
LTGLQTVRHIFAPGDNGLPGLEHSSVYLVQKWSVLWNVTRNELRAKYAGSLLGVTWAFLGPLILLAVYAVVYIAILGVHVTGLSSAQYAVFIFAGLVPFMMNAEAISSGVSSVLANVSVLNNSVFPIDLVPPKAVLLSQGVMVAGMSVVLAGTVVTGLLQWTVILLPVIWALHLLALTGLVWLLSLLGVVFRDLTHAIGLVIATLYVISPIAYTREMVPQSLAPIIFLNPVAYYVMSYQDILVRGEIPSASHLIVMTVMSFGLFLFGGWFFFRVKRVIVDYI